ncbi:MAG: hypothetical protein KatS3mg123_3096 [Burkholderiales bacterium]|nr:MAG: hypothetical protein KatS3mg123_3096 [Burkholderiales bacterium]
MKTAPLVLIIDDERKLVRSLEFALKGAGIDARGAFDGESGLKLAAEIDPDAVLLDLRLPEVSGMEVLAALKAARPDLPVIMISAHGDTRAAVQCVKAGASDYLTKPFDLDELVHLIESTVKRRRIDQEVAYRRGLTASEAVIVGEHPATQRLREQVARVAASSARTILLLGASGTGKAVVARAIHQESERRAGPFVEVNCASLPEPLLEAELFGAEKGAYTGAHQRRVGLVALADGGTLFLDEIGELAPPLQAKLLSFLENRTYRPLGSAREAAADVRVVAATNRDLAAEVRAGRYREDLYYRLNVVPMELPALQDRGEDVFLLAAHFAERFAREEGCAPVKLGEAARRLFRAYPWPGERAGTAQPDGAAHHSPSRPDHRALAPPPGDETLRSGRSGGRSPRLARAPGGGRARLAAGSAGPGPGPEGPRCPVAGHLPPRPQAAAQAPQGGLSGNRSASRPLERKALKGPGASFGATG